MFYLQAGKLEEAVAYGRIEFEKVSGVEEFRQVIEVVKHVSILQWAQCSALHHKISYACSMTQDDLINHKAFGICT